MIGGDEPRPKRQHIIPPLTVSTPINLHPSRRGAALKQAFDFATGECAIHLRYSADTPFWVQLARPDMAVVSVHPWRAQKWHEMIGNKHTNHPKGKKKRFSKSLSKGETEQRRDLIVHPLNPQRS